MLTFMFRGQQYFIYFYGCVVSVSMNLTKMCFCKLLWIDIWVFQFSSVAQLCPTLCSPMDCRTPGFPVQHQLLELAQTHVHRVGDAIQPTHPLPSTSPTAFNLSQHQGLFQSGLCIRWPKYWSFSFSISPCNEYSFPLGLTGLISL